MQLGPAPVSTATFLLHIYARDPTISDRTLYFVFENNNTFWVLVTFFFRQPNASRQLLIKKRNIISATAQILSTISDHVIFNILLNFVDGVSAWSVEVHGRLPS